MPQILSAFGASPNSADEERRAKEVILELQTSAFSYAQTYTTIVVFGAYAAIFTIWGFTRDQLPTHVTLWVAALLGVSLTIFVLHEIFGMIMRSAQLFKMSRVLSQQSGPGQFLAAHAKASKEIALFTQRVAIPVWAVALFVSVVTGIGSAFILVYHLAMGIYKGAI